MPTLRTAGKLAGLRLALGNLFPSIHMPACMTATPPIFKLLSVKPITTFLRTKLELFVPSMQENEGRLGYWFHRTPSFQRAHKGPDTECK